MKKTDWLIIIGILILIMILAVFPFIVSASWVIPKDVTCEMLNISGGLCDNLWCEIIDCEYDSTLEACMCDKIINKTVECDIEEYLDEDEFEERVEEIILKMVNESIEDFNEGYDFDESDVNKTYLDNRFKEFLTSTDSKLEDIKDDVRGINYRPYDSNGDINPTYIIIAVLLIGGILLFMNQTKQKGSNPITQGEAQTVHRKIQTSQEISKEGQIEELKKQLKDKEEQEKKELKNKLEEKKKEKTEEENKVEGLKKQIEELKKEKAQAEKEKGE